MELKMILHDGNEYTFSKIDEETLNRKMSQENAEGELYKRMAALIRDNDVVLKAAKPNVTKNSAGYFLWNVYDPTEKTFDMTRLLTGSQGTLGIITEIKFKLVRPDPASRLMVIFLKDLAPLADIASIMLRHRPESFESYDNNTFRLAMKFFPEILGRLKGSIIRIGMSLIPEAWLLLTTGGIPKMVLLVEFSAESVQDADRRAKAAEAELIKAYPSLKVRVTKSDIETQQFWVIRRESFSLLRHHMRGLRTAPFIDDFAVRAETLPQFLPELYSILNTYKLIYTVSGHIGDGNFHIIPMMDFTKPETKNIIVDLSNKVYKLVFKYHGTITGEHNDGLIRSPFLKEQFGQEIYSYFELTKKIFDPDNIFNPGKKTGSDLNYAMAHLDTPVKEPKRILVSA